MVSADFNGDNLPDIATANYMNSASVLLNCTVTGLQNMAENSEHISIYPNPASDYLQVEAKYSKLILINIYDVLGKDNEYLHGFLIYSLIFSFKMLLLIK